MHAVQLPQWLLTGGVHRQRQVGEDLAEEEPRAVVPVEQVGVLADPAEARVARERLLEHRRAVRARAKGAGPGRGRQPVRETREPGAQHLVIVAAERIAGDVAEARIAQHAFGIRGLGPVVHARRDHAQRPGYELGGARAARTVPRHVMHLAVPAGVEPVLQPALVVGQVDRRDPDALEAKFLAPGPGLRCEPCGVDAHWDYGVPGPA